MKYVKFYHYGNSENGRFITAGLKVIDDHGKTVKEFYDVSCDFNAFGNFVKMLNDSDINLLEIEYIIENYYCDYY